MITSIESQRLVVLSDLHLGNPFCQSHREIIDFVRWAAARGFDIVINGDGLDIAQVSFPKLSREVPGFLSALRTAGRQGCRAYYVVGNHDIALEHFLEDWGAFTVAPFLNVRSGSLRVRIEHGHLYDPFFVRSPHLYEWATRMGGWLLKIHPGLYRLWIRFEKMKSARRARKGKALLGEPAEFSAAALELSQRGFDAVVFGHTHHPGQLVLPNGARYFNPGSWLMGTHYVEISQGQVELKVWQRTSAQPTTLLKAV